MKNLIFILSLLLLASCAEKKKKEDYSHPQKVIIAGKILNHNPNHKAVKLSVNKLGLSQEQVFTETDAEGNFHATFETYLPVDVWVLYNTNFLTLVHPGDSLYIEFDGNHNDRPQLLETIKFSGDAAKANREAARYQQMYYSNPVYHDWDAKSKAVKEYDMEQYLAYLDTVNMRNMEIYDRFVKEVSPSEEVKIWALIFAESNYYHHLVYYPNDHRRANNLTKENWDVPSEFYNRMFERLPVEKSMLISAYSISGFVNKFHYYIARPKALAADGVDSLIQFFPGGYAGEPRVIDSILINGIIEYTPDTLLRQMVLTEYFYGDLDRNNITGFEQNMNIIDNYIKEPFLIEPLLDKYEKTKNFMENPQIVTDAILKEVSNSKAGEIMGEILAENKGKVIYIDFWGTWCGPCISEMPNSKKLMKEMSGQDVEFVYICIDSEETNWKAKIAELELAGQHYFLTREQSADIRKNFDIRGIPFYMLINKNGTIVDKGSHIRPGSSKQKIVELL